MKLTHDSDCAWYQCEICDCGLLLKVIRAVETPHDLTEQANTHMANLTEFQQIQLEKKNASLDITVPIRTVSEANQREHWAAKAKRVKRHRNMVALMLNGKHLPALPVTVTITRQSPRLLDDDNLRSALKGCRDAVAAVYGKDDRGDHIRWVYLQEKRKEQGVRVQIESRAA